MDDFREPPARRTGWMLGALSGIQAGVLGALGILVFMAVVSIAQRESWWSYPNLLATVFYGGRALHSGPGWTTISGVAFQILLAGIAGSVFGVLFAAMQNASRLMLIGVIWGIGWLYILQSLSRIFARLIPVYAPELALLGAHTVFGLILGRCSRIPFERSVPEPGLDTSSDTSDSIS